MLTSRAEFRLILRHDNADMRLRDYAYNVGSINQETYDKFISKKKSIQNLIEYLKENKFNIEEENKSIPKYEYLKRPNINIIDLVDTNLYTNEILEQVEILVKYEGYIKKSYQEADKLKKLESKKIPDDIDYKKINNLASEAKQKLLLVKPETIGQASRISGVNPADISVLSVYLKKEYNKNE